MHGSNGKIKGEWIEEMEKEKKKKGLKYRFMRYLVSN